MPACPQCHTELEPGWEQCEHCGYQPTGREWEGQLGEPAGTAPGVGAPRWGPGPTGATNGNGHGHAHAAPAPPEGRMRWVLVAAAVGVVVLVVVLVALL